jgi:hypothetical protein
MDLTTSFEWCYFSPAMPDSMTGAAHGLDGLSESRKQEIAALFEARNTILGDPEFLGHANLRELASSPQLTQGQIPRNRIRRAGLDLPALGRAQLLSLI